MVDEHQAVAVRIDLRVTVMNIASNEAETRTPLSSSCYITGNREDVYDVQLVRITLAGRRPT